MMKLDASLTERIQLSEAHVSMKHEQYEVSNHLGFSNAATEHHVGYLLEDEINRTF